MNSCRSATLLAKPTRANEPLHSPTSKRNQVQFTTFTTLDIKHLAALKRNGMEVSWAAPVVSNYAEPKAASSPLPDMTYPTATPHVQAPHMQVPHMQAPHMQAPHMQVPHVQMPHVQA